MKGGTITLVKIARGILEQANIGGAMALPINRRTFLKRSTIGLGVAVVGGSVAWWVSAPADPPQRKTPNGDLLETVPRRSLPSFALKAGPRAQEAYRYAAANSEDLQYIPCFCGCKNIGHRSNGDCYVAERLADGRITFTSHGAR
jgi:Protein of unknown function with PCYCGC motif